jgi:transposase
MSDNALIEKLLNLPEFEVTDFKQNDYDMGLYIQARHRPDVFPACGVVEPRLIIYKSRTQNTRDMNVQNKRVALILTRRYYRCTECDSCFSEPLESIHDRNRMTIRLSSHIAQKARYMSFVDIENEYQISDTTIRKAFLEDVQKLPSFSELETPRVLGIDGICLLNNEYSRKQPWAVIANGDAKTVMDILKERNKPNIISTLQSLRNPKKVEVVTMDMWPTYRNVVYETLPKALPVIDKFHVVKMANEQLDSKRRQICNKARSSVAVGST